MTMTLNTLDQQIPDATLSYYGVVSYERGFEIVEVEGWVREEAGDWLVVYGNPDLPAQAQRRTALLKRRVIEIDLLPNT